jgi:hypothetical protein
MKYWEIIADNLSKAGWSWGCVKGSRKHHVNSTVRRCVEIDYSELVEKEQLLANFFPAHAIRDFLKDLTK